MSPGEPSPERFDVSRRILWTDRVMKHGIRTGGVAVILAVFGIFLFIGKEVLPLFGPARMRPGRQAALRQAGHPVALGCDEWGTVAYFYGGGGEVEFVDLESGRARRAAVEIPTGARVTAVAHDAWNQRIALGLSDGRVGSVRIEYETKFGADGRRIPEPKLIAEPWFEPETGSGAVVALACGEGGERRMVAVERGGGEARTLSVMRFGRRRSLLGAGKLKLLGEENVTSLLPAAPELLRVSPTGETLLVSMDDGGVAVFGGGDGAELEQVFSPFGGGRIARMDFLFGGMTVVLTSGDGRQEGWSPFRAESGERRRFGRTKVFPELSAGDGAVFAASRRNKSFLTGVGRKLSLRYGTTASVRWNGEAGIDVALAAFDGKSEHIVLASENGEIQRMDLSDSHPEAGWRAFFGKIWYEGAPAPAYQWQSTGGSDEFEPKLSLVPLVFGSLKGTFYALLFSVPVALLAAVFSANFLSPGVKRVLKPTMEIMASLPSVVLGFLGGLWLAPLIETRVPSLLLAMLSLPAAALLAGWLAGLLPLRVRRRFAENGREWWLVAPLLAGAALAAWHLGPVFENMALVYQDPETGERIADFRLWWPQATGAPFDQRNSMVVGFMMGFAVIPVIFTIAEDALSNVPQSLKAAGAALGASRWQIVRTVVLPVASPGIFSALMIGFGRAVGETMIMVMATGNTPLMEWNIFSGMRTLAANIAVELPEAPAGSTHYRTLFLGAMLLFSMTFALNTAAEVLRARLREKYKIV